MATSASILPRAEAQRSRPLTLGRVLVYAVLVLGALASVLPFVYMIMTSFKTYGSVITNNVWPWPPFGSEALQVQNYPDAIRDIGWDSAWNTFLFVRYFANSVIMSVAIVAGVLVTSVLAAYALAQM